MNMMTTVTPPALPLGPAGAPIAMLRSLPPGTLAKRYERLRRLAELFAALDRDDMEAGAELLIAEMDARDGEPDCCEAGDDRLGPILPHPVKMGSDDEPWHVGDDAEDDDPIEANGDEHDTGRGEDEEGAVHGITGPGCPIADAPEPTLGSSEEGSGYWPASETADNDGEVEAAWQPATLNPDGGHAAANHRVPA